MLDSYIQQTRRLLHDAGLQFFSQFDLIQWINEARQQVAAEGQCIRVLPPSTAGVDTVTPIAGGSGYTTATVTLSAPNLITGTQATATATIVAGAITGYTVTNPGSGYYIVPSVTITGDGTGATAVATLLPALATVTNGEVYAFSQANPFVQQTPGVRAVIDLQSVSIYWGNLKPTLTYWPWSKFQARVRAWPLFSNLPSLWSRYAQGEAGTIFMWPIPVEVLGMDWDCICVPVNLTNDSTVEAIPEPWQNAVQYYACRQAFMNAQRYDDADKMFGYYQLQMRRARTFSQRTLKMNPYDASVMY